MKKKYSEKLEENDGITSHPDLFLSAPFLEYLEQHFNSLIVCYSLSPSSSTSSTLDFTFFENYTLYMKLLLHAADEFLLMCIEKQWISSEKNFLLCPVHISSSVQKEFEEISQELRNHSSFH